WARAARTKLQYSTARYPLAHVRAPCVRGRPPIRRPASTRLLPPAFQQGGHVHLIRFVIAGQCVHHDVHARPKREFALAWLGRDEREHGLAVLAQCPSPGEIVRGDDNRRYAVASASRTARGLLVLGSRQCLDPKLAGVETARKVLQQVEG